MSLQRVLSKPRDGRDNVLRMLPYDSTVSSASRIGPRASSLQTCSWMTIWGMSPTSWKILVAPRFLLTSRGTGIVRSLIGGYGKAVFESLAILRVLTGLLP